VSDLRRGPSISTMRRWIFGRPAASLPCAAGPTMKIERLAAEATDRKGRRRLRHEVNRLLISRDGTLATVDMVNKQRSKAYRFTPRVVLKLSLCTHAFETPDDPIFELQIPKESTVNIEVDPKFVGPRFKTRTVKCLSYPRSA
jgi:hypothetical protein